MLQLKRNPYHLLLMMGVILIITSWFIDQNLTLDVHVHDTYYVIGITQIFWLFALIVWVLWFLNLITQKLLYSKSYTWLHVIITLIAIVILIFLLCFGNGNFYPIPRRFISFSSMNKFDVFSSLNVRLIIFCIIIFFLGQITYLINLVLGLIKRFRQ